VLYGVVALLAGGLLIYSQKISFTWDEGYHLVAAQLIAAGKKPYVDFVFPQTPFNAYWNAGWMQLLGISWRVPHAWAALLTGGCVLLMADYIHRRLPIPEWRLATALTVAFATACSVPVIGFGTLAQAYGMCLFLIAAGFRLTVLAVDAKTLFLAAMAGFCAGAAAASSLLTAPAVVVLALWLVLYNGQGNRWTKLAAFSGGTTVAFLPVIGLFVEAPRAVFFSLIEYQLRYRTVWWPGVAEHNIETMLSWLDSSQALLLGLLAVSGGLFVVYKSGWDRRLRAEFYLCGWLALALAVHISTARPTFAWYYLLLVPFLSVLAAVGLYWVGSCLYSRDRPALPVIVFGAVFILGLGKWMWEGRDYSWRQYTEVAEKVRQVTPPHGRIMANEQVYFLLKQIPPTGMELEDSHKLTLPEDVAQKLHVVTISELHRRLETGFFQTVQTCDGEDWNQELGLSRLYARRADVHGCNIFWDSIPGRATNFASTRP
jgi:hypothetical protein